MHKTITRRGLIKESRHETLSIITNSQETNTEHESSSNCDENHLLFVSIMNKHMYTGMFDESVLYICIHSFYQDTVINA